MQICFVIVLVVEMSNAIFSGNITVLSNAGFIKTIKTAEEILARLVLLQSNNIAFLFLRLLPEQKSSGADLLCNRTSSENAKCSIFKKHHCIERRQI